MAASTWPEGHGDRLSDGRGFLHSITICPAFLALVFLAFD